MKKIILLSAVACMAFYACKKDSTSETAPVTETLKDSINPVALSAAVKIGYGATNVKGSMPAASTDANAPVLDSLYNGRPYDAISNRYVVIYPRNLSGYIAGYYLKINGADSYFKIDYKAGYGLRKAHHATLPGLREEGDNSDSSIIIKLPDHLLGDTFSISYAAYDSLNRVSNTITAIVNVISSKDSTDDSKVLGTWEVARVKQGETSDWIKYSGIDSSNFNYYTCSENTLQYSEDSTGIYLPDYINSGAFTFMFGAKNLATVTQSGLSLQLNLETSSCSNAKYDQTNSINNFTNGGYSYNAATKILTIIQDADGTGSYISALKCNVKVFTSTEILFFLTGTSNWNSHDEVNDVIYYDLIKK